MTTIPVQLSESLEEFVSQKAAERGLSSAGEYLALLAEEQRLREAKSALEAQLLAGIRSPKIAVDDEWWEKKRQEWSAELDSQGSE